MYINLYNLLNISNNVVLILVPSFKKSLLSLNQSLDHSVYLYFHSCLKYLKKYIVNLIRLITKYHLLYAYLIQSYLFFFYLVFLPYSRPPRKKRDNIGTAKNMIPCDSSLVNLTYDGYMMNGKVCV